MANGWSFLEPLESTAPGGELDHVRVNAACNEIETLNGKLRRDLAAALEQRKHNKWANGLRYAWSKSDDELFNAYFANKAHGFAVPRSPPDKLDGCRASICFHMSDQLQAKLLEHLRGVPTAEVMNASASSNADQFRAVYRFTSLRAMVVAIKSVQTDVEDFAGLALELLQGKIDGQTVRATTWPFDADIMEEQVLFGFMRTQSARLLNSAYMSSPIVAAGLVRSHLESVLFRTDFQSSLDGEVQTPAEAWAKALKVHRDAGRVSLQLSYWVTELYGLLSVALHSGTSLSRGEVWAFTRVVRGLKSALKRSPQEHEARWVRLFLDESISV